MHDTVYNFVKDNITPEHIEGKRILEVGSSNVQPDLVETVRRFISSMDPKEYIGVDISWGDGVDMLCSAEDLVSVFGYNSFDVVISTETLEHSLNWKRALTSIKGVCNEGGIILLSARDRDFQIHGYPGDYWRFSVDSMKDMLSDFFILSIEKDPIPGVMVIAKKPVYYNNLLSDQSMEYCDVPSVFDIYSGSSIIYHPCALIIGFDGYYVSNLASYNSIGGYTVFIAEALLRSGWIPYIEVDGSYHIMGDED